MTTYQWISVPTLGYQIQEGITAVDDFNVQDSLSLWARYPFGMPEQKSVQKNVARGFLASLNEIVLSLLFSAGWVSVFSSRFSDMLCIAYVIGGS